MESSFSLASFFAFLRSFWVMSRPLTNARPLPIAPQMRAQPKPSVKRWPRRRNVSARPDTTQEQDQDACSRFNAQFTPFYLSQARKYDKAGRRQTDTEDRLRALLAEQKQLRDRLRRQAFAAQHPTVRRTLMRQARAVDADIRSKRAMLRRLSARNKSRRSTWQAQFKAKTAKILGQRPPGCRVKVMVGQP